MAKEPKKLNLDELAPVGAEITYGGKKIKVNPPKTGQLIKLISSAQKMSNALEEQNPEKVEAHSNEQKEVLWEVVPEIKDKEMSFGQITSMVELVVDMAMPEQIEHLKKQGISPAEVKKNLQG